MNQIFRRSVASRVITGVATSMMIGAACTSVLAQRVASDQLHTLRVADVLNRPVTVDLDRVSVERAIRAITTSANVRVTYRAVELDGVTVPVTLHAKHLSLGMALEAVLSGTGLSVEPVTMDAIKIRAALASGALAQGGISGKIVDSKTNQPLRGATVTLDDASKGLTSGDDGVFRIANVAPGQHTIRVRMLGYVKAAKTATVVEGQTIAVEVALEQSANALDQVIVTGTVVAMERRAIPNAMTVITAKDIEQRGITRIDQLFRGDVPGLFSVNQGSTNALDAVTLFSRGATALSYSSAGVDPKIAGGLTNTMKTYVDGVELADPHYLSQIDPQSIERIEILSGPQASTIYGSNAINGVMQVFTKRGTSARPQLTATLLSGFVQNDFRPTLTPQHDYTAQVNGTEGRWAYNAGGSWTYMGPWTPGKQTARTSGFGGARLQLGPLSADANFRLATTQNRHGGDVQQTSVNYIESGWYKFSFLSGDAGVRRETLLGQTLGLTMTYAPLSWWSHDLVIGSDRANTEDRRTSIRYLLASDTNLTLSQTASNRTSIRYSTTAQIPVTSFAKVVATVGADTWNNLLTTLSITTPTLTGTLIGTPTVSRQPGHNTGTFLQTQVGLHDQLFFTYGLRAEWNPDFGDKIQPNLSPRYGVAYTQEFGAVTAKLRASYGRSTRPPIPGEKERETVADAVRNVNGVALQADYGNFDYVRANPDLGPETQQGGEGGVELYFGQRGSFVLTRYNQTVDNLIAGVQVDSVKSFSTVLNYASPHSRDADGYGYEGITQYLNIGSIRNQGWEATGTLTLGPMTTRGTYSWTKSIVIGVAEKYRTLVPGTQHLNGMSFQNFPMHTWGLATTYTGPRTTLTLNLDGMGQSQSSVNSFYAAHLDGNNIRLTQNRLSMNFNSYTAGIRPGEITADANATHRFSSRVDGIVQVTNLTDKYYDEFYGAYAVLGRQTKAGFRIRY